VGTTGEPLGDHLAQDRIESSQVRPMSGTQARADAPEAIGPRSSPTFRIMQMLEARSPGFVLLVGALLVVLIGVLDGLTGRLSLTLFYLVPVVLVSFSRGRALAAFICAMVSVTLTIDGVVDGWVAWPSRVAVWNLLIRFCAYFTIALLSATLYDALQRQRLVAERETNDAKALRELNELKDTLLRAVSHDLRSPIAVILGSVRTLQRSEQLRLTPAQRDELLEAIRASAGRSDRLVSDLLDLERLDRGLVSPDLAATDLRDLVERVIRESDALTAHPVRVQGPALRIWVDAGKIERIVENLLVNAAHHTPLGTPVVVTIASLAGREQGALVSVADEGPGVADDLKERIFEPFRQGEQARASGHGTGIGLSLASRFAALHGGRVWVEDRPGGGAVFFLRVPGRVDETPVPAGRSSFVGGADRAASSAGGGIRTRTGTGPASS
jgi:signal transduction histidine kinase